MLCIILVCYSAPEGPPLSVSALPLDSSSLILTWEPPLLELRNGIIQQYTIRITELKSGTVITVSTEDTSINVTSLHPHYEYNITVAAETFDVGLFSSPFVIQLPESCMYKHLRDSKFLPYNMHVYNFYSSFQSSV